MNYENCYKWEQVGTGKMLPNTNINNGQDAYSTKLLKSFLGGNMDPITIAMALAAVLGTKALEKTGDVYWAGGVG